MTVPAAPGPSPPPDPAPDPRPPRRALILEDDPAVRALYTRVLRDQGFEVFAAGTGAEASAWLEQLAGAVDLLVLDVALPDTDGTIFAKDTAKRWGARPTLYVSAFSDEYIPLSDAPGRWEVLQKPFPLEQLIRSVNRLTGS